MKPVVYVPWNQVLPRIFSGSDLALPLTPGRAADPCTRGYLRCDQPPYAIDHGRCGREELRESPFCVKGTVAATITGANYMIDGGLITTSQAPGSWY